MQKGNTVKLIILDRDGVINIDSPNYIKSPAEWLPIPGSLEAIAALNKAGYTVVIATNQSGLGRGLFNLETLHAIHEKMQTTLATLDGHIDFIAFCPHTPEDECACRKPRPGLLLQISQRYNCTLQDLPIIGDSYRDINAALNVGAQPILVLTGNGQKTQTQISPDQKVLVYPDLKTAVENIIDSSL